MKKEKRVQRKLVEKGKFSYIKSQKRLYGNLTLAGMLMVLMLFFSGYLATGTRNNIMTVVAILSVLPTAKFAATFFMLLPYHSQSKEVYDEVLSHAGDTILLTDMVITTKEKILPTDFFVVRNGNACGYSSSEKYDTAFAEKFLAENLKLNGLKVNVKIFRDKKQFLNRVDALSSAASDEKKKPQDERTASTLLTLIP